MVGHWWCLVWFLLGSGLAFAVGRGVGMKRHIMDCQRDAGEETAFEPEINIDLAVSAAPTCVSAYLVADLSRRCERAEDVQGLVDAMVLTGSLHDNLAVFLVDSRIIPPTIPAWMSPDDLRRMCNESRRLRGERG